MGRNITVLIESCFLVSKGRYNLVLDFTNKEEFKAFCTGMNVLDTGAYMVEILGYQSKKRLRSDTYHSLNLDSLRKAKYLPFEQNSNQIAFCARYDFSQCDMDDYGALLQTHPKLDCLLGNMAPYLEPYVALDKLPVAENDKKDVILRVNSVGQGNWNEILYGEDVRVVYDIGADIHATNAHIQELVGNRKTDYMRSRPVLFLSHWDLDHYICLKELEAECIRQMFSAFVCSGIIHGLTAVEVCKKMQKALNKECYFLEPAEKTSVPVAQAMHLESKRNSLLLYKGERRHNRNRSGLILLVEGETRVACLSGDALLSQAEYVVNHSKISKDNILVVPHHGGDCQVSERHYELAHAKCDMALISVGDKNMYNHPSPLMHDYLSDIFASVEDTRALDMKNPIIKGL